MAKKKVVLKDAFLYYTKIKNPGLEYQKKPDPDSAWMNREFVVDVLVPESRYKAFKKTYKTVKAVKDAREFDAKEFEKTFKVAPPFEADTYYVFKLKRKAYYNDGNEGYRPQVIGCKGKVKDRKGLAVNAEVELGNGTLADVMFEERLWDNDFGKGLSLDLYAVSVKELVEYVQEDSLEGFDIEDDEDDDLVGFGSDDSDDSEGDEAEEAPSKDRSADEDEEW